jgi:hypothetical protein
MDSAKAKTVVRGNPITKGEPVLPPPPIPKKVLESNKPLSTIDVGEEKAPASSELLDRKVEVKGDEKPKGTITIYLYDNRPYEAKFDGKIAGFEMNIAVPALRKGYKLWKRELLKQGGK